MEVLQRFVRTINYNLVLCAVAAAVFLYACTSPIIAGPVLSFCFAGIVPGTNTVIDPDTMMQAISVVLGLAIVAGLLVWLRRMILVRRAMLVGGADVPATPAQHAVVRSRVQHLTAPNWNGVINPGRLPLRAISYRLHWIAAHAQLLALRGLRVAVSVVTRLSSLLMRSARSMSLCIGLAGRRFGHWTYPHLQTADGWLEVQTRKAATIIRRSFLRLEVVQVTADIVRETRNSLRQLFKRG